MFCMPFSVYAQFFSSPPTINGTCDDVSYVENGNWHIGWDDTNLYICVEAAGQANEPVKIYLDVNPVTPANGGGSSDGNLVGSTDFDIAANLPFRADIDLIWESGFTAYQEANGSGGWGVDLTSGFTSSFNGTNREISIAWNGLGPATGRPASFNWLGYSNSRATPGFIFDEEPSDNPSGLDSPVMEYYYTISNTDNTSPTKPFDQTSFSRISSSSLADGTYFDITINGGIDFAGDIVTNTLYISTGGFVINNAPSYGIESTLVYDVNGTYERNTEWTSSATPHDVEIAAGTIWNILNIDNFGPGGTLTTSGSLIINGSFDLENAGEDLRVLEDISVNNGGELIFSETNGADIFLLGNLTINGNLEIGGGSRGRAFFFEGAGTKIIASDDNSVSIPYIVLGTGPSDANVITLQTQAGTDFAVTAPRGGNAISFEGDNKVLDLNGNNLTLGTAGQSVAINNTGSTTPGTITVSSTTDLAIQGTGAFTGLNLTGGSGTVDDLTLNLTSGGSATIDGSLIILDSLITTSGTLALAAGHTLTTGVASLTGSDEMTVTFTGASGANNDEGWRVLSPPLSGVTVADLAAQNHVQGLTGQTGLLGSGDPNLYVGYDGTDFQEPTSVNATLDGGSGLIWYFFDRTSGANGKVIDGSGFTLNTGSGTTSSTRSDPDASYSLTTGVDANNFSLVGNPYPRPLDLTKLVGQGGVLPATAHVWNPETESYATPSSVGVWQGFFLENPNNASAVIYADQASVATSPTFYGKRAQEDALSFGIELSGPGVFDGATTLRLSQAGADGWDQYDATELVPLTFPFASLSFIAEHNGETVWRAQESRYLDLERTHTIPMRLNTEGVSGIFTISAPALPTLPPGWSIKLEDRDAGEVVDLSQADYSFEVVEAANKRSEAWRALSLPRAIKMSDFAGASRSKNDAARFVLHVGPNAAVVTSTGGGEAPSVASAITSAYPNPFADRFEVAFGLEAPGEVSLEVFDLLGREVMRSDLGARIAGNQSAELDGGALPSGVYVVRLTVDGAPVGTHRVIRMR
jgi:hypothetical protein